MIFINRKQQYLLISKQYLEIMTISNEYTLTC